jgi:RNA polymerase sigma-70 factor (ECF subfamily)
MTWRLFWESVVVGKSIPELALETGRSAGAIYMARFKVLQRLKTKARELSGIWECPPGDSI